MRNNYLTHSIAALLLTCLASLYGCGGGGGGGSTTPPASTVSGVAAAGAVIVGSVSLKDSAATPREITHATSDGSFSFDVTGLTKPFMLRATGTANNAQQPALYSLAADGGTANINPVSNLVVAAAAGSGDLASVYGASDRSGLQVVANKLGSALVDVQSALSPFLAGYHVAGTVDPIKGAYKADGTGLDGMLDQVTIGVGSTGIVTITDHGPAAVPAATRSVVIGLTARGVSGTVASANNLGLAGVTVSYSNGTGSTVGAITDGNGRYSFSIPANGSYTVSASRANVYTPTAASFEPAGREVAISDASSFAVADFTSNLDSFTVSGHLSKLSGGLPVAQVSLKLVTKNATGALQTSFAAIYSTVSDAQGNYSLSGIPDGYYALTPSLTDFAFAYTGAIGATTADNFLVSGLDKTLDFTVRPTSDATGGVTGN